MKSFRVVFMQVVLVVALMVGVSYLLGLPEVHQDGKASIQHDAEGEVIDVTEKENYAYAHLTFPGVWILAAPTLWLERSNWAPNVAFRHALARTVIFISLLTVVILAFSLRHVFKELKDARTDAANEEMAELKARLPFNGWSTLYLVLFVSVASVDGLSGHGFLLALLILIISEIIRSLIYRRRSKVRKHWKLVREVKTPKGSSKKAIKIKKTTPRQSSQPQSPAQPTSSQTRFNGPIYPV